MIHIHKLLTDTIYVLDISVVAGSITSRCPYREHITPVLESLHWLPAKYRILFKLLLLTYKCLNGLGPGYLSCLVMPRKHRYEPRPQYQGQLCRFRRLDLSLIMLYGERIFGFSAPTEWNKLPIDVRSALTLASFKVKLKTHLYKICYK